jgi:hypothetical protein
MRDAAQRNSTRDDNMPHVHRKMKEQLHADSLAMAKVMQEANDLRESTLSYLERSTRS